MECKHSLNKTFAQQWIDKFEGEGQGLTKTELRLPKNVLTCLGKKLTTMFQQSQAPSDEPPWDLKIYEW